MNTIIRGMEISNETKNAQLSTSTSTDISLDYQHSDFIGQNCSKVSFILHISIHGLDVHKNLQRRRLGT